MASSFAEQIPVIIHIVKKLKPATVLDIGKGFGKYGFLIHEYYGIDNTKKLDSKLTMIQQSAVKIDAVEVDKDLLLPHLPHLYNTIYTGDILKTYTTLPKYDLILMIDIIEHINKNEAKEMVKYFLSKGSRMIIATPINFFEQSLYESEYEHHVSHWAAKDFASLGKMSWQSMSGGGIYVLSTDEIKIIGFGNSIMQRTKRIARAIRNEFH